MLAAFQLTPGTIDPQLAAVLVNIDNFAFLLTRAIDALMIGAVAAVALRTAVLPRWMRRLGRRARPAAAGEPRRRRQRTAGVPARPAVVRRGERRAR